MKDKNKRIFLGILMIASAIALIGFMAGQGRRPDGAGNIPATVQGQYASTADDGSARDGQTAEKIQIYLFHPTRRCSTCIAIGQYAEKTVNESFQGELASGKIEFKEINIDLPENQVLVEKFQASGSALYINSVIGGKDNIAEDADVWRLTNDEAGFKSYLKGKIDNLLGK